MRYLNVLCYQDAVLNWQQRNPPVHIQIPSAHISAWAILNEQELLITHANKTLQRITITSTTQTVTASWDLPGIAEHLVIKNLGDSIIAYMAIGKNIYSLRLEANITE